MHIIMGLLAVLGTIGVLIWRIRAAAEAAQEIKGIAETAANLPRRLAFRRRSGKSGSKLVTDPREAAVVLMLEMARASGEITREHKAEITDILVEHFDFTADDADEVITQASWVSQAEAGTDGLLRRMVKVITEAVGQSEVISLDGMLVQVSEVEGMPKPEQLSVLSTYRALTGVRA